jgi:hypothetical protein
MDFERDIREHVLASLPHNPADRPALAARSAGELLVSYLNWTSRFVAPQPRKVHEATALAAKVSTLDQPRQAAFILLIVALERGDDITPHLSKEVRVGVELPKLRGRRRDLDLLLNDWGIHHLHLGTAVLADGFVSRSGPLLFAMFKPNDVYLIDICEHRPAPWSKRSLLETAVREWPSAGLLLEIKDALPGVRQFSDEELGKLRAHGYSSAIEVDGKVFKPGLGMVTTGTSTATTLKAIHIMKLAGKIEKQLNAKAGPLWSEIVAKSSLLPLDADFHFHILDRGFGVFEAKTETLFELSL